MHSVRKLHYMWTNVLINVSMTDQMRNIKIGKIYMPKVIKIGQSVLSLTSGGQIRRSGQ